MFYTDDTSKNTKKINGIKVPLKKTIKKNSTSKAISSKTISSKAISSKSISSKSISSKAISSKSISSKSISSKAISSKSISSKIISKKKPPTEISQKKKSYKKVEHVNKEVVLDSGHKVRNEIELGTDVCKPSVYVLYVYCVCFFVHHLMVCIIIEVNRLR